MKNMSRLLSMRICSHPFNTSKLICNSMENLIPFAVVSFIGEGTDDDKIVSEVPSIFDTLVMLDVRYESSSYTSSGAERKEKTKNHYVKRGESDGDLDKIGMEFSVGILDRSGYKCDSDGELVSRLRSCGAIPLLVSNTPELCLCWECHNFITGTTKNPYDSTCTSGGSSGGEGALLGAGASVIGIGSDIAGSIRLPAMFNGVFGHKPTPRIASVKGHYPSSYEDKFYDMMVIGPLTRYAEDLRLMMNIMVDPPLKSKLKLKEKADLKKIRVFYMQEVGSMMIQSVQMEIQLAVKEAVKYLGTKCGATIEEYKFHEFKDALQVCGKLLFSIREIPNPLKGVTTNMELEFLKSIMGYSKCTPNIIYFLLQQKIFDNVVADHNLEAAMWKKSFTDILGEDGVFIYPTSTTSASKHHEFYFTIPTVAYTIIPSALGLPATSVPCGLDRNGLPIGIQVIAPPNQDRLCLTVAEELEKCFGGWIPPK